MDKKYEYRVVYINTFDTTINTVEHRLNELGEEGWELISVDTKYDWYYLRREKGNGDAIKIKDARRSGDRYTDAFNDMMDSYGDFKELFG